MVERLGPGNAAGRPADHHGQLQLPIRLRHVVGQFDRVVGTDQGRGQRDEHEGPAARRAHVHDPLGVRPQLRLRGLGVAGQTAIDQQVDHVLAVVGAGAEDLARLQRQQHLQALQPDRERRQIPVVGAAAGDVAGQALQHRKVVGPLLENAVRGLVAPQRQPSRGGGGRQVLQRKHLFAHHHGGKRRPAGRRETPQLEDSPHRDFRALFRTAGRWGHGDFPISMAASTARRPQGHLNTGTSAQSKKSRAGDDLPPAGEISRTRA